MNRCQGQWIGPSVIGSVWMIAGCSHQAPTNRASATPQPTATPFPLAVRVDGMHSTITDLAGRTIAKLTADRAVLAPSKEAVPSDPIGMLVGASAILYENDTPSLTLVADTLHADRDTRIVVGKGNVTIRSLRQVDTPTIRADTMTWSYNKNLIVGEGHVVVTRQPDIVLPGNRFTADTALRHYTLYASAVPATGSF